MSRLRCHLSTVAYVLNPDTPTSTITARILWIRVDGFCAGASPSRSPACSDAAAPTPSDTAEDEERQRDDGEDDENGPQHGDSVWLMVQRCRWIRQLLV